MAGAAFAFLALAGVPWQYALDVGVL
jgi:hypothetical protein